ncbi:MAG TPA: hypothetical protein VFQ44_12675 [Streptosporangiaceae bacterium]|nr:hypothetical protein [Streptosporangiaceae bacterium]
MKQSNAIRAVEKLLRDQGYLITRSQALSAGLTLDALRHRLRKGGPWTAVLPGIYVLGTGMLTAGQREIAAALYGGPACVITGVAALQRQGVRVPPCDYVDVLIPADLKRQNAGFIRTHRTTRMPERFWVADGIRWAPAARAVADAVRGLCEPREVSALVAASVQQRKCTIAGLAAELREGPTNGSGALRAALDEVADGARSAAEGDLRQLVRASRLAEPLYNAELYVGSEFLAQPDAWWPEAGLAGEVDSREWHILPADWARTMARHSKMSAQGIIVIHFTPRQLRTEGSRIAAELKSAIAAGRKRPPLAVRTVPARR